jgi:hypothetical protein
MLTSSSSHEEEQKQLLNGSSGEDSEGGDSPKENEKLNKKKRQNIVTRACVCNFIFVCIVLYSYLFQTNCKQAHAKCDENKPCARCVRMGKADSCSIPTEVSIKLFHCIIPFHF